MSAVIVHVFVYNKTNETTKKSKYTQASCRKNSATPHATNRTQKEHKEATHARLKTEPHTDRACCGSLIVMEAFVREREGIVCCVQTCLLHTAVSITKGGKSAAQRCV